MQKFILFNLLILISVLHLDAKERNNEVTNLGDPAFHFILSGYISCSSNLIIATVKPECSAFARYALSGTIGLIPGVGKEIYDYQYAGKEFDWCDLVVDVSGVAAGLLVNYLAFDRKKPHHQASVKYYHQTWQLYYAYRF